MKIFQLKKIDFKLIGYLITYYTIVTILSSARIINQKLSLISEGLIKREDVDFNKLFYDILMDWIIVINLMIILAYFTKKMINRKVKWKNILLVHLFFSLILGWVIYFVFNAICVIRGHYKTYEIVNNISFKQIVSVADLNFLIYTAMMAIIYIYYYVKEIKKIESQKVELSAQLNYAKLNLLKSNLHPHFLFNTLNSISSLVETDIRQAQNTIADLGDLLRDLLEQKNKNLITVEEEIYILNKYLNIIKVRFSDHFSFKKNIDKSVINAKIPSMLLQPLIENAIKHGYSYDYTDLIISLNISKKNDRLVISIINNGKPLEGKFTSLKKGLGIKNTLERLRTIYKNDFVFKLKNSKSKKNVISYVNLPLILE